MKFNEINKVQWADNKPYLDTCLLPITGLSGEEGPAEVTEALEKLRDMMDLLEIPFKGRIVTYPALHFIKGDSSDWGMIEAVCRNLKKDNFAYCVIVTSQPLEGHPYCPAVDLWVNPESLDADMATDIASVKSSLHQRVRNMWNNQAVN